MKKISSLLIALFLVVGTSLIGSQQAVSDEKVTCTDSQFEVRIESGEISCVENVDINVNL